VFADANIDAKLREAILTQLAADPRTAGAELRVGVQAGIAHLAGEVNTQAERDAAEEIACGVGGVRGVVNRIAAPGAPSPLRPVNLDLGDSSDRGGDRSNRGGDRSDRGGDRSNRGGDRSNRGGDRSNRPLDR